MTPTILAAPLVRRRRMRFHLTALLATAALVGIIGCGGDSGTGPTKADPTGLYGLMQVDARAIPVEIFRGNYYDPTVGYAYPLVLEVTGGEISLQPGGDFHLAVDRNWSSGGRQGSGSLTVDGTYRIEGGKIYIDTGGGSGDGSYQNGVITLSLDVGETGTMKKYTFRHAP